MRHTVRFLLLLALLLSAGSVAPVGALAQTLTDTATPSATTPVSGTGDPSASTDPLDPAATATPSPSGEATTSAPGTGGSSGSAVPRPLAGTTTASPTTPAATPTATATPDPSLVTTIVARPTAVSVDRSPTFGYRANRPGVAFRCRLLGPGHTSQAFRACPATGGSATSTVGAITYSGLAPSTKAYTFRVQAYVPAVGVPGSTTFLPEADGTTPRYAWRLYGVYAPGRYSPPGGARFNNPIGSHASQRTNLTHVIRTINAMPGYRQGAQGARCPADPALWPSRIRVSLYSMVDGAFSSAARAANRRCISVQILMNNHLTPATDYSWGQLERSLGNRVTAGGVARRSFAHRCHFGCRGHGVLHTKMYLFDSTVPAPAQSRNRIVKTVMTGSSNITSNASKVQWNDLYTIRNNATVHRDYQQMFDRMKSGRKSSTLYTYDEGAYTSVFWPQGSRTDPYRTFLGSVHCTGATGGSGINGRTVVYVNMHAWFGTRGLSLARQIRGLYNRGCYVRVLYSFMSFKVFTTLKRNTGARMSARRTLFSHDGHTGYLYSHLKNIDVSGNMGGDSSTWVVSTGSNNFTNEGTHFDEVALRIRSRAAYNSYVRHFKYMSARRSSPFYANYSEPTGGGRAP